MLALSIAALDHLAALLPVGGRRRQGHRARRARLDGHRLHRDRRLGHFADHLHQGQRADRRQPRRPVHQPGADLRHAAFGADRRRDVPALSGAGAGPGAGRHRACRIQRAQDGDALASQGHCAEEGATRPRLLDRHEGQVRSRRRRTAAAWPSRSTCAPAPAPAPFPGTARRDRAARWRRRPAGCGRAGSWRC